MAKFSDVNNIVSGGDEAIYRLKEVLKAAGWVVNQSSDGTTYNAAGDQITGFNSGANGMANSLAWFEIQEPEVNGRSWTFQRSSVNNEQWRIKLSVAAEFSGGTPGVTQTPSATDEQILAGGGDDGTPTWTDIFDGGFTYYWHVVAESTPVGPAGNRAYGFWAFSNPVGTSNGATMIMQEPMAAGSYAPLSGTRIAPTGGEPDPCIYILQNDLDSYYVNSVQPGGWQDNDRNRTPPRAFYDYGGGAEAFTRWRTYNGEIQDPNGRNMISTGGTSAHGFDVAAALLIANPSQDAVQVGWKGCTAFLKFEIANRSYPSTISLASGAYVYHGQLLIPWEDGTLPQM